MANIPQIVNSKTTLILKELADTRGIIIEAPVIE